MIRTLPPEVEISQLAKENEELIREINKLSTKDFLPQEQSAQRSLSNKSAYNAVVPEDKPMWQCDMRDFASDLTRGEFCRCLFRKLLLNLISVLTFKNFKNF